MFLHIHQNIIHKFYINMTTELMYIIMAIAINDLFIIAIIIINISRIEQYATDLHGRMYEIIIKGYEELDERISAFGTTCNDLDTEIVQLNHAIDVTKEDINAKIDQLAREFTSEIHHLTSSLKNKCDEIYIEMYGLHANI